MSAGQFSKYIQRKLIPHIKQKAAKDIRDILNTRINQIRITEKNIPDLMKLYKWDEDTATDAWKFIVNDISKDSGFKRVQGSPGGPNVFRPIPKRGKKRIEYQYNALRKWKTSMGAKLSEKFGKEAGSFGQDFHLGHGSSSFSVVHYLGLEAGKSIKKHSGVSSQQFKEFEKGLQDLFLEEEVGPSHRIDISAKVDEAFTQGVKFKRNYKVYLDLQIGSENLEEGANIEKHFRKKVLSLLDEVAEKWPGSKNSLDTVADSLVASLNKKKLPKVKKTQQTNPINISKKKGSSKLKGGVSPSKDRMRDAKGRFSSPIALMNLINARLHDIVKKNMVSPALVYDTGRFAKSAKVTNISQTRQGQLTAFYTYMKSPYQTFERGYAQGSARRDPRQLLSKSIREAAVQIMGSRYEVRTRRQ